MSLPRNSCELRILKPVGSTYNIMKERGRIGWSEGLLPLAPVSDFGRIRSKTCSIRRPCIFDWLGEPRFLDLPPDLSLISFTALKSVPTRKTAFLLFNNILSDCHKSDEIYYLLNAFRLDKKRKTADI